jgi:uncharacterized protein YndB with AHSA1/START domain
LHLVKGGEVMEQARIERQATLSLGPDAAWSRVVGRFAEWFGPDASLDPRPGGEVSSDGRVGHVTSLVSPHRITWEWSRDGDPGWAEVEITLTGIIAGTRVEVVEILHAWEQEQYEARASDRPGPFGVLAVAR